MTARRIEPPASRQTLLKQPDDADVEYQRGGSQRNTRADDGLGRDVKPRRETVQAPERIAEPEPA